jgi:phenylacetate-CoA ligase
VGIGLRLKYAFRHVLKRNPLVSRWCAELMSREMADPGVHRTRQRQLLERLFREARQIPAYAAHAHMDERTDAIEHLQRFPLIDKHEVLRHQSDYFQGGRMPSHRFTVAATSGTTGTPFDVYRSLNSMVTEEAFHLQHWHWAGWRPGQRQAVLRGDSVVPTERRQPPYWFEDVAGDQLLLSTRHLDRDSAAHFAERLRRFDTRLLRAYPSAAHDLAVFTEECGIPLRIDAVITGSEMLYGFQRERVERVFGARVFDFYSMTERVAFAAECERGRLHVNPEYGVVEILDPHGRPTDGEGMLVGTSLHNYVMPLIRYRMGDTARWSREPCACGRTYPVIEHISGRLADQLFDRDGRAVNCTLIGFAFDGMKNIRKAQVAQVSADRWEIRIVPSADYSHGDGERVLARLSRHVSARVSAQIVLVTDIDSLASGKYQWVVQEWQPAAGELRWKNGSAAGLRRSGSSR